MIPPTGCPRCGHNLTLLLGIAGQRNAQCVPCNLIWYANNPVAQAAFPLDCLGLKV